MRPFSDGMPCSMAALAPGGRNGGASSHLMSCSLSKTCSCCASADGPISSAAKRARAITVFCCILMSSSLVCDQLMMYGEVLLSAAEWSSLGQSIFAPFERGVDGVEECKVRL